MTDRSSLVRGATEALAAAPIDDRPPSQADRHDAIAALTRALDERRRAARRRRAAFGISAAAAAACAIAVGAWTRRPPPSLSVAAREGSISSPSDRLVPGDHVVAPTGGALVLASGTRISLGAKSDLGVLGVGRTVALDVRAGHAQFDVAKLASGDRFLVRTLDTEVEVRGTSFSVALVAPEARCGATPTRIVVSEGVVSVRHGGVETQLHAGDAWPRCASLVTPPVVEQPVIAPPSPAPHPSNAASATNATKPEKPSPASDLAAQNDLFAAGVAAKRRGDREGAVQAFDQLLHKWPGSPHAENAAAERMRLASGARATAFAKAYLARWPSGFAAKEASAILAQP